MATNYYDSNAEIFFNRTFQIDMSQLYEKFLPLIPEGGHILDAGCGTGRDSKFFFEKGYRVDSFDSSKELVRLASKYTELPIQLMAFEEFSISDYYDGVWASASLLHVPLSDLPKIYSHLGASLKAGGVLYASFKYGAGETDRDGRRFTDMNETSFTSLLKPIPNFKLIELWKSESLTPNSTQTWLNSLVQKL